VKTWGSACGKGLEGDAQEYKSCNKGSCEPNVDCQFDEWGHWSACSASCNGVKARDRGIRRQAQGYGKACVGGTKEVTPCNLCDPPEV